ncbi:MAG TPA: hypothetical protein VGB45_04835 [Abditibacterium sp.]
MKTGSYYSDSSGALRMGDYIDQNYLVTGLEKTTSFQQTLQWWKGPWVGYGGDGQEIAFYRPLSSLCWWLQYRAFGPNGAGSFMMMHWMYHLAVCLLAVAFFRRVVGYTSAWMGVAIWASGIAAMLSLPSPQPALSWWKDSPDLWIAGSAILTLWSLLSFWRTSKIVFLVSAIFFQIVGIAFKEMAYITPLLAGLVLWFEWKKSPFEIKRHHWVPIAALLLIVVAAYIFRTWALQGPGFRFGTNGSWFFRWVQYVLGGRPANLFVSGQVTPVAIALLGLGFWMMGAKKHRAGFVLGIAGASLIIWADWKSGQPLQTVSQFLAFSPAVPFWQMPIVRDSLLSLVIVGLWVGFLKQLDPTQLFGFCWIVLSYVPLMTAPITEHALYLPSMGWGIFLGVAMQHCFRWFKSKRVS